MSTFNPKLLQGFTTCAAVAVLMQTGIATAGPVTHYRSNGYQPAPQAYFQQPAQRQYVPPQPPVQSGWPAPRAGVTVPSQPHQMYRSPYPAPRDEGPQWRPAPPLPVEPYRDPTKSLTYRAIQPFEPVLNAGERYARPIISCGIGGMSGSPYGPAGAVTGCVGGAILGR